MVDKKINSSSIWTIAIIVIILAFSAYILMKNNNPSSKITEELATCIGQNSELYIQTGCIHCKTQEDLFEDYLGYLDRINCFESENRQRCAVAGIEGTPTWIINGEKFSGVRQISELKKLTGC